MTITMVKLVIGTLNVDGWRGHEVETEALVREGTVDILVVTETKMKALGTMHSELCVAVSTHKGNKPAQGNWGVAILARQDLHHLISEVEGKVEGQSAIIKIADIII